MKIIKGIRAPALLLLTTLLFASGQSCAWTMADDMPMPAAGAMPTATRPAPMPGAAMAMEDDMPMPAADAMPVATPAAPMPGGAMRMDNDMPMEPPKPAAGCCMGMMGGMNSPTAMAIPSMEAGLPGQSHLYHIDATGFFLDHPEHITLTLQQQQMLALHKEQALLKRTEQQVQIDATEQQLWQLTGADQPQIAAIETKTREIERLRADQRLAFVRAVRDSAQLLTNEQRMQLSGLAPAQPAPMAAPAPMPAPMPMEGDM